MGESVLFLGEGPFSIAPAQSASARALPSAVGMTINAIVGDDPFPRPIHIQMTPGVAAKLGHELIKAAVDLEANQPFEAVT